MNEVRVIVGAVFINGEPYDRKTTLVACVADDKTFFWDDDPQTLYIHFEFDLLPETQRYTIGLLNGYSFYGEEESFYIDDIKYEPRIKSVPRISYKVDKFRPQKMRFTDQTIVLDNGNGVLDTFIQDPVPGAEASIALYDTETDTEITFFTGFVDADTNTYDDVSIKVLDKRRRENVKVPNARFDSTTYPDIESKYVNKIIPEGYGAVKRVTCFPLNGTVGSGNIQFKYATDATTLTSVEVLDDDVWTDVTGSVANSSPSTGYFELPYATATNASGAVLRCVCTATLRNFSTPGEIIKDMNNRYNSIAYDATNYNQTEWTSEDAKLADSMYLYMAKKQEFFKWIEILQTESDYWFVYTIQGDGKRTLRVNDPNRAVSRAVKFYDIKDDRKRVNRDFTEYASTVGVSYNEDFEEESVDRSENDDYEDTVLRQYRYAENNELNGSFTDSADADRKAALVAEDRSEARPVVTWSEHITSLSQLTDSLYDIINVETSRPDETYWQPVDDSITADYSASDSITFDYTASDSVTLTVGSEMVVEGGEGREYFGTLRSQILEISFNPTDLTYTISARERPVSEVV